MSVLFIHNKSFHCQEKCNIHGRPIMLFLLGKSKLETKIKIKKVTQWEQSQSNGNRISLGNSVITMQLEWMPVHKQMYKKSDSFFKSFNSYSQSFSHQATKKITSVKFLLPSPLSDFWNLMQNHPCWCGEGHSSHHVVIDPPSSGHRVASEKSSLPSSMLSTAASVLFTEYRKLSVALRAHSRLKLSVIPATLLP